MPFTALFLSPALLRATLDKGYAAPTAIQSAAIPALLQGRDIGQALSALPDNFRIAVVLRDVEELSYEEIAAALQIPMGTVMSRIHRGRALIRTALQGSKP